MRATCRLYDMTAATTFHSDGKLGDGAAFRQFVA
jgi:hypothetical protein